LLVPEGLGSKISHGLNSKVEEWVVRRSVFQTKEDV